MARSLNNMDNRPKRILFIDDEKDVLESIKCVLELKNKFIVDAFSDGESALKATVEKIMTAYDLVLLDIKMPGIDGFELYQRIKEKAPQMKVAFITASEIERKELEEKLPNEKENIEMIL